MHKSATHSLHLQARCRLPAPQALPILRIFPDEEPSDGAVQAHLWQRRPRLLSGLPKNDASKRKLVGDRKGGPLKSKS